MTTEDWSKILATTVQHAQEYLGDCKSEHPTVTLDELAEHEDRVGYFDLRTLCIEHPEVLAGAGLTYDDEHRLLLWTEDPPVLRGRSEPSE